MSTKIYVEGGGDHKRTLAACRAGFSKYFEKITPGKMPRVVASGSRQKAYEDFLKGVNDQDYERVLLLVDAEAAVAVGDDAWEHLNKRDRWTKPNGAQDDSAHLMVQCMESWFLADKEALAGYYGQDFKANSLPARKEIELVSKADVQAGLEQATNKTQKETYHKTQHGFDILGAIDPTKVGAASNFAALLHEAVKK